MKKIRENKGFTLVELLAVIVVLAIVMSLAVVAITSVLDNARKATFVSEAKSFLEGARNVVNSNDLISVIDHSKAKHVISCDDNAEHETTIKLDEIPLQQGGVKSPYGSNYDKTNSFIKVVASKETGSTVCKYTYSIFLSDGVYAIGTSDSPVEWSAIETSEVKVLQNS